MGRSSPPASLEEAAWRNRYKRDVDTQTPPQTGAGWEVGCHEGSTNFPYPYEHRWLGGGGSEAWTKEEGSNKSRHHMAKHGHTSSDLVFYLLSVCICPLTPWTLFYMWVFLHETLFYRSVFFYMCVFYMRHFFTGAFFLHVCFFTWDTFLPELFLHVSFFLHETLFYRSVFFYMCVFLQMSFFTQICFFYRIDFFVSHICSAPYNQGLPMNILHRTRSSPGYV
jgi:hypothetical protein